ncbi:cytochrome b [Pseudidiomarina sediminum]|uniref:Cytochrome b n=1 Tax=Pseudidiomarina sediminum TaxID=431675 RepID=A0A432Z3Y1_9GAMM|nr:cytochrome b [Pseudidiomarina sediminum]MBY6062739.1 cytochrome b [Pseudidiomarina sediminum]RUO72543.1 cytochrome b [Pseudidiomarina sediminum]
MLNDSTARYGSVSKFFHWVMATLLAWQFLKFFDRISDGEHWVGENLVPYHVSIGTVLLLLVVLRLVWSIRQSKQRPEPENASRVLVKAGHGLLYLSMLLMPISGIMYLVGKGYGLKVFGMQLIARGEEMQWMADLGHYHSPIAWVMLVLVAGHIVMGLVHHFIKKDNTLKRML